MYLVQNLKYLRIKTKETQKDIAKLLGVSEMTVCRYESGENEPDLKKLIEISRHYDVSIDELLMSELKEELPLYIKNIIFLRKEHKMLQKDIAEFLHVSKATVCKYENGNVGMTIEQFIKLADYFGITLDQMVNCDLSKKDDYLNISRQEAVKCQH